MTNHNVSDVANWEIIYSFKIIFFRASLVAQRVKHLPAMPETACKAGDQGSIPGPGRPPGEGNGNPLQDNRG